MATSASAPWIAIAIACGFLSGLISGIAITRFRVTALVATLAVNALLYGTVLYLTKGTSTEAVPPMLSRFAVGRIYGIPYARHLALALILLIEIGIRATVSGRRFVAVGVERTRRARRELAGDYLRGCDLRRRRCVLCAERGSARRLFARSEPAASETAIYCQRSRSWCSAERRCWVVRAASPPRRSARSFWSNSSRSSSAWEHPHLRNS